MPEFGMRGNNNDDLFRQQAIRSLARKAPGRPICLMPRPWLWLTFLVVVTFSATAVFIATAEYARKERAPGWVVAEAGVIRVSAPRAATVSEVAVSAGARIVAGEPLLLLSSDSVLPDGGGKSDQVLSQLRLEMAELGMQSEYSDRQFELETESIEHQLGGFETEISSTSSGLAAQQRRIALGQHKLQRLVGAADGGAVTAWDVIRQRELVTELEQELLQLQQGQLRLQRERDTLKSRLEGLPNQAYVQRSVLNVRRRQLHQDMTEHESRRLSMLSSPVDGVVASIQVIAGDTLGPGQTTMTVLPKNALLAAEIYVPSRAAGFIQPGQDVRLSYAAFPRQKFGTFAGRVTSVSGYVLLPREIPQTFAISEAAYKVTVEIESPELFTVPEPAVLRPGMLLTAEIILEKRNLIDWLLEPLQVFRGSAG